jgi:hypothetical protein
MNGGVTTLPLSSDVEILRSAVLGGTPHLRSQWNLFVMRGTPFQTLQLTFILIRAPSPL